MFKNRYSKCKHFPWARYIHRHLTSNNWSTFLQHNVPKWECPQTGFTQGLLSILNLLLGMRSLCSAHTTFKTWLNYIFAQLLNCSKLWKKLFSSLLQSHPMSVTSLWLSVLTLMFRKMSSFVSVASYQTAKFMHYLFGYMQYSSYFCTSIQKSSNLLFVYIKKWDLLISSS